MRCGGVHANVIYRNTHSQLLPNLQRISWAQNRTTSNGTTSNAECNANVLGTSVQQTSSTTTPLARMLHSQMMFTGPITLSDFMQQCLTHPTHGYYTTRTEIFGRTGDFVTAPDITPVFSELIGVFVANYLQQKVAEKSKNLTSISLPLQQQFHLVELGPGNGSLLQTMLLTLSRLQCMPSSLTLIDASAALRKHQQDILEKLRQDRVDVPHVSWFENVEEGLTALEELSNNAGTRCPTIVIAHEFLDALPVHVFHRVSPMDTQTPITKQWSELLVDAVPPAANTNRPEQQLRLVLSPRATPASSLLNVVAPEHDETVVEICPRAQTLTRKLGRLVAQNGGIVLFIDYGEMRRRGRTVRALSRHESADILDRPGEHDVTADVDFGTLQRVVEQDGVAAFVGAVSQRDFLLRLGAANRFRVLAKTIIDKGGKDHIIDEKLKRLQQDYDRIVGRGTGAMGEVYKVAAVCPKNLSRLAGFETIQNAL